MDWITVLALIFGPICFLIFRYVVIAPIIWLIKGITPKFMLIEREDSWQVSFTVTLIIFGMLFWMSSWPTTPLN